VTSGTLEVFVMLLNSTGTITGAAVSCLGVQPVKGRRQ
jgi:hypothetical protein